MSKCIFVEFLADHKIGGTITVHDGVKCHRSSPSAAVLVGKGDRLRQFQGPTIVLDKICWRTIEINRFRLIINYNCYSKYESNQRRCLLFIMVVVVVIIVSIVVAIVYTTLHRYWKTLLFRVLIFILYLLLI